MLKVFFIALLTLSLSSCRTYSLRGAYDDESIQLVIKLSIIDGQFDTCIEQLKGLVAASRAEEGNNSFSIH